MKDPHATMRFNLSRLLLRLAPDSEATKAFATAEGSTHGDWVEDDRDGLLSRVEVGWGGAGPSPLEPTQMLALTAAEALEKVTSEMLILTRSDEAYSLLGALQQAVRTNPSWGVDLTLAALSEQSPSERIIESLIWGLRESECQVSDQLRLITSLARTVWPAQVTNAIGSLIDKWARDLKEKSGVDLLDALDLLADVVFDRSQSAAPEIEDRGWTERAINHASGHAAQVWWSVANARNRLNGPFVLAITDGERERWQKVIGDSTAAGTFARPILGMVSERLSAGDFPWSEAVLFPAFEPARGEERASQLWDGRLMQSRWSWSLVRGLKPSLQGFLKNSASLVPARSKELGDVIGLFVAHTLDTRFDLPLLQLFVQNATREARQAFADRLPSHLRRLSADSRRQLWRDLLLPYWSDRRTNVPLAFDHEEVGEMISWPVALPEVAEEVLQELDKTEGERFAHADHILWDWEQDDAWIKAHPNVAAGLVGILASRHSIQPWSADRTVKVLEQIFGFGADRNRVLAATEALIETTSSQRAAAFAKALQMK